MDERGVVLQRLYEVRLDRVLQKNGHGAMRLQVARQHRFLVAGIADHDLAQALLEIVERSRQAEDRHDFGGDHDIEAVLPRIAVAGAAQAHRDVAQGPVVHVHDPAPGDAPYVDPEFVSVMDVVVEHRREQIVGERNGVEVSGEVQVDVLHRNNLRVAAAGGPALHAEDRSERGLAQTDHGFLADVIERIAQSHRGRGLALACRCRADRGHQDQFGVRPGLEPAQIGKGYLGLVVPVGFEMFFWNAELG